MSKSVKRLVLGILALAMVVGTLSASAQVPNDVKGCTHNNTCH
jgi:hypothetical protein